MAQRKAAVYVLDPVAQPGIDYATYGQGPEREFFRPRREMISYDEGELSPTASGNVGGTYVPQGGGQSALGTLASGAAALYGGSQLMGMFGGKEAEASKVATRPAGGVVDPANAQGGPSLSGFWDHMKQQFGLGDGTPTGTGVTPGGKLEAVNDWIAAGGTPSSAGVATLRPDVTTVVPTGDGGFERVSLQSQAAAPTTGVGGVAPVGDNLGDVMVLPGVKPPNPAGLGSYGAEPATLSYDDALKGTAPISSPAAPGGVPATGSAAAAGAEGATGAAAAKPATGGLASLADGVNVRQAGASGAAAGALKYATTGDAKAAGREALIATGQSAAGQALGNAIAGNFNMSAGSQIASNVGTSAASGLVRGVRGYMGGEKASKAAREGAYQTAGSYIGTAIGSYFGPAGIAIGNAVGGYIGSGVRVAADEVADTAEDVWDTVVDWF